MGNTIDNINSLQKKVAENPRSVTIPTQFTGATVEGLIKLMERKKMFKVQDAIRAAVAAMLEREGL